MDNNTQNNYHAPSTAAPQEQAAPFTPPPVTDGLPFVPKKQTDDAVKSRHANIIIILLACILVVNVAVLVKQFLPSRMGEGAIRMFDPTNGSGSSPQQFDGSGENTRSGNNTNG